jgi:hypothetical protein
MRTMTEILLSLSTCGANFNLELELVLDGVGQTFVINSGSGSGTSRLCRYVPLLFEKENLKTVCPRFH